MADQFYAYDSDSEESVQSSNKNDEPIVSGDNEPNPYWFEFSDADEDEFTRQKYQTAEEKLQDALTSYSYNYDRADETGKWEVAYESFKDLASKIETFLNKMSRVERMRFGKRSSEGERVGLLANIWEVVTDFDPSKSRNKHFIQLAQVHPQFRDFLVEWEKTTEEIIKNDATEGSGSELSAKEILDMLQDIWNGKRARLSTSDMLREPALASAPAVTISIGVVTAMKDVMTESLRNETCVLVSTLAENCAALLPVLRNVTLGRLELVDSFEKMDDNKMASSTVVLIPGGINPLFDLLLKEITRTMRNTQLHDKRYAQLLRLEQDLCDLLGFLLASTQKNTNAFAKLLLRSIGQRTYKSHAALMARCEGSAFRASNAMTTNIEESVQSITAKLSADEKALGALYRVYQLGLKGDFIQGRDLLIRSAILETSNYWNAETRLLFNRVTAILGLAAFASGKFSESSDALGKLYPGTAKESMEIVPKRLGQLRGPWGIQLKGDDNTKAVTRALQAHLVPPHLDIQLAHIELAYILSCVVHERLNEARRPFGFTTFTPTAIQNLAYWREKNVLFGSPKGLIDAMIAVNEALQKSNCDEVVKILSQLEAWKGFPLMGLPNGPKDFVINRVKEDSLRIFCTTVGSSYSTISLDMVTKRFGLGETVAKCIINQTLLDKEATLVAFWDDAEKFLHVDRGSVTRLQHLISNATNKISDLHAVASGFQQGRGRGGRGGRGRGGRGRGTR